MDHYFKYSVIGVIFQRKRTIAELMPVALYITLLNVWSVAVE